MGTEDGTSNSDNTECAERVLCLESEAVSNGVEVADGNDFAEAACYLKSEAINNEVAIADENDAAEKACHLKSKAISNGVEVADRNDPTEESWRLKSEAINNGVATADGNVVIEEALCLKSEAISNGVAIADGFDSADRDSGGLECLHTYKRRKQVKSSSESKVQEDSREYVEAASHLVADQETFKTVKDGQECSSQFEWLSHRTQSVANGHANVMHNGCSSGPHDHGVTEMCQDVLCNILTSEKFSSLCKALLDNFQGMNPESVSDFSVMNSRMEEQAYEQSPALFLSDIQQVWRKLQDTGNKIVALAKSLSNMSRTSYCELVGISAQSTFEDEKQVFYNLESDSHMKPVETEECATYKIFSCRCCGDKADGTDCLVCDSCEEVYHVSCIEPAVKEIPHKNWYCANCTASGIGSPHENCVVCERLNDGKTLNNVVGDESFPTNEENELEENSNSTYDGIQLSIGGKTLPNCKICGNNVDGEKIKICGHPFCPNKYYHVRCLTSTQLKSYGHCWYCPSCLCRVCFTDQDDDQIVLCDGCDHAYHIYCMKPPQTSIPRGKWFCRKCDAGIEVTCRAKRAYESNKWRKTGKDVSRPSANLEKKCNNKRLRELERGGGMDMLLTAANTLNFEEKLAAIQIESQRT